MTSFSSKILLFGEHIVNCGSNALAVPFNNYSCNLLLKKQYEENAHYIKDSKIILSDLAKYFKSIKLYKDLNVAEFEIDISQGLKIKMNIPIGYGLGSSGALISCIYEKYRIKRELDINNLKEVLGKMESFFHGKSSGLDPIVSYLNKPVLVKNKDTQIINEKIYWRSSLHCFLLDTKKSRKTEPLVNSFLKKYNENKSFKLLVQTKLIPLTNKIVDKLIHNDYQQILTLIKELSELQLKNYQALILKDIISIWHEGLEKDSYFLKICGAGGGGFMLGYAHSKNIKLPKNAFWI